MPGNASPYASWIDPATERLLRSAPPASALRWAADASGGAIERWTALRGGTSSAMYVLDVAGAGAAASRLVLRCHVRPELAAEAPTTVTMEAAALRAVAPLALATPELVAADPTGAQAGVPSVVMGWLPGRVVWDPTDPTPWLARLAEVVAIVQGAATDDADLGGYSSYRPRRDEPPAWAGDRRVWARALEVFHGPVLDPERGFVHRDVHPGNVLWQRGQVSGVVDWASACVGPPSIDVAHCRANLLGYAPELADRFTDEAERATGRRFHRWADIASLIGMLDGLRDHPPPPAGRRAIERALAQAVADCG